MKTERCINATNVYVREYLRKECSSDLQYLVSTLNNPAKEISESMAAVNHLCKFINPKGNMNYVVIGDGSRCLTGAFLAYLTKGNVWSIDPAINQQIVQDWMSTFNVLRFKPIPKRVQNIQIKNGDKNPVTIVLVHAHVSTYEVIQKFPNWRFIYVNPCCYQETQLLDIEHQNKYGIQCVYAGIDENIASDKSQVLIYHNNAKFPKDMIRVR